MVTAMYCLVSHVWQQAGHPDLFTIEGATRDSTHPAVTSNPSLWSAAAPVLGQGHVDPKLFQFLAVHKAGPEL